MKSGAGSFSRAGVLLLVVVSLSLGCGGEKPVDYTVTRRIVQQPVDHSNPGGATFPQEVRILIPQGAPLNSPVFFNLGNEADKENKDVIRLYTGYGSPKNVIFIQAEHRGYGQSVTDNADQSVPKYVRIDQALADYHRVIGILKREYAGPWMASGYSYGGGLVIHFAAKYPHDVKVILSSSGVIDWPFVMDVYDRKVRLVFGESAYGRLVQHINNLEPSQLFDENWIEREFLIAIIHGVTQYGQYKSLLPIVKIMIFLPTSWLLTVLHWIDDGIAQQGAWKYATSNAKKTLSRSEAITGRWGWRFWRYQQCTETGVFEISDKPQGIFTRTRDNFIDECRALFGAYPPAAREPEWSPRSMLKELSVPLIYVGGGMDPWEELGLEPKYKLTNGKYFYLPDARHCPDYRDEPQVAKEVLEEMLKYARGEQ